MTCFIALDRAKFYSDITDKFKREEFHIIYREKKNFIPQRLGLRSLKPPVGPAQEPDNSGMPHEQRKHVTVHI